LKCPKVQNTPPFACEEVPDDQNSNCHCTWRHGWVNMQKF
jgi:hypothetical protein